MGAEEEEGGEKEEKERERERGKKKKENCYPATVLAFAFFLLPVPTTSGPPPFRCDFPAASDLGTPPIPFPPRKREKRQKRRKERRRKKLVVLHFLFHKK